MDKETLSNYGWIVVCVLVLATLLAFASPFSNFLARGFEATSAGFAFTSDSALTDTLDDLGVVFSTDELQSKYKFYYYSSLALAVDDINAGTIGKNADVDKEHAVAGVYVYKEMPYAVLLKDNKEEREVTPNVNMTINLGGNTLNSTQDVVIKSSALNLVIDGRLEGSTIFKDNGSSRISLIETLNANNDITINKGNYIVDTNGSVNVVVFQFNGNVSASDIIINSSTNSNNCKGIQCSGNNANITNSKFTLNGPNAVSAAIVSTSTTNIENCEIKVDGNIVCTVITKNSTTANNNTITATGKTQCAGIQVETNNGCSYFNNNKINVKDNTIAIAYNLICPAEITNNQLETAAPVAIGIQATSNNKVKVDNCKIETDGMQTSSGIVSFSPADVSNSTINSISNNGNSTCIQIVNTGLCCLDNNTLVSTGPKGQSTGLLLDCPIEMKKQNVQVTGKTATCVQNNATGTTDIDNCTLEATATTWSTSLILKCDSVISNSIIKSNGNTQDSTCIQQNQRSLKVNNCKLYSQNPILACGITFTKDGDKAELIDCIMEIESSKTAYGIYSKTHTPKQTNCQFTVVAPTCKDVKIY